MFDTNSRLESKTIEHAVIQTHQCGQVDDHLMWPTLDRCAMTYSWTQPKRQRDPTQRPTSADRRTDPMREQPCICAELETEDDSDERDDDLLCLVHGVDPEKHHERRDVDANHGRGPFVAHVVRASNQVHITML